MRFLQKKVAPNLLVVMVIALVLAAAVAVGVVATQAVAWPGANETSTTTAAAASTTTTTEAAAEVEYETIRIRMMMEAGAAQYVAWSSGLTIHAGIGWLEPFGRASYVAGVNYAETAQYPKPDYMNDTWMSIYGTGLFCIYQLPDGNIYAYDGIVGNLEPKANDDGKMDMLINVIVGGDGAYEGCNGMLLGTTPGRGAETEVGPVSLPVSILKLMEGYINIPVED